VKKVVKDKNLKKVCTLYQDDDYGQEVMTGGEHGLKDMGMAYTERTTYKRGATDFSSQVAKMKEAGCEVVVMGTIVRETIGTIATARRLGWNPEFIGVTATYFDIIHKLGGPAMNGFYSACTINYPYEDDPSEKVRAWFASYKDKYKEDPTVMSVYGYQLTSMFAAVAKNAGQNLTPDTLAAALEKFEWPADIFGADGQKFSPTKKLGSDRAMLCQIQNGRWKSVSEYLVH
jgi:branched-chain amino acid transport system substrate-binding protein